MVSLGSAFAQDVAGTTITPYARLDVGVSDTGVTDKPEVLLVQNAGYNGSHFGVKTTTDLRHTGAGQYVGSV